MTETQIIGELAAAVGKIASGLFIITSAHHEKKDGYLGSWVQQVSFSPLMLALAIKPGRPCYDLIKAHGRVCINIVGQNNGGMMKPFWSPKPDVDPFATLEYTVSARGNILLANSLAAIECELRSSASPGDHEILFVEVMDAKVFQSEDKPLFHVRKSGMGY